MAGEFGVEIPDHQIVSRLGRGGMATVYLARNRTLGRLVAVKVIDSQFEANPEFRKRFDREAKTAASLTHPNIVPVYHYGFTEDQRPYLTMGFMEGGSLRDRLREQKTLPIDVALGITKQVASALLVAHQRHIVHRDLKPDNVLFQGETALLTDFGIAKVLDAATELTGTGINPGTVKYFSPEQAKEEPLDQRSDIYTLGVVLFEMLTGELPTRGDTVVQLVMAIAHRDPLRLAESLKGVQPFMDVLLAKDPADRLGSCSDVVAIITAMERNWFRYNDVNRLTDGITLAPSGKAAPRSDLDDEPTQVLQPNESTKAPELTPAPSERQTAESVHDTFALTGAVAAPQKTEQLALTIPLAAASPRVEPQIDGQHTEKHNGLPPRLLFASVAAVVALGLGIWWPPATQDETILEEERKPAARTEQTTVEAAPAVVTPMPTPDAPEPSPTTLTLDVVPSTALVSLLEPKLPYTPDMQLPAGVVKVLVREVGYKPVELELNVQAGVTNRFPIILETEALTATFSLNVTPADAKVSLPDIEPKYSPGMLLPVGSVRVRVSKPGFVDQEQIFTLAAGANEYAMALVEDLEAVRAEAAASRRNTKKQYDFEPDMVVIPAGSFDMGSPSTEPERGDDEGPVHPVTIRSFALARTETTRAQFARFVDDSGYNAGDDWRNPGYAQEETHPVVSIDWEAARAFAKWLAEKTGKPYRLPSEAEFEYANRARSTTRFPWGNDPADACDYGNVRDPSVNASGRYGTFDSFSCNDGFVLTAPVGRFAANAFGVHDMAGNVWEWTQDCYVGSYANAPRDGSANTSGDCAWRVLRGGSWGTKPGNLRSALRFGHLPSFRLGYLGFRVAQDL